MTQAWVVLTRADGRDTSAPSESDLAEALAAVFSGKPGADGEPASATLRFGYDDGLMYVLEVSGDGEIGFEEWSDRDCEIALASPRRMTAGKSEAFQLWCWLAQAGLI